MRFHVRAVAVKNRRAFFPVPDAAHIVLAVWERKVTEVGIFERDPISGFLDGRLVQALEPR